MIAIRRYPSVPYGSKTNEWPHLVESSVDPLEGVITKLKQCRMGTRANPSGVQNGNQVGQGQIPLNNQLSGGVQGGNASNGNGGNDGDDHFNPANNGHGYDLDFDDDIAEESEDENELSDLEDITSNELDGLLAEAALAYAIDSSEFDEDYEVGSEVTEVTDSDEKTVPPISSGGPGRSGDPRGPRGPKGPGGPGGPGGSGGSSGPNGPRSSLQPGFPLDDNGLLHPIKKSEDGYKGYEPDFSGFLPVDKSSDSEFLASTACKPKSFNPDEQRLSRAMVHSWLKSLELYLVACSTSPRNMVAMGLTFLQGRALNHVTSERARLVRLGVWSNTYVEFANILLKAYGVVDHEFEVRTKLMTAELRGRDMLGYARYVNNLISQLPDEMDENKVAWFLNGINDQELYAEVITQPATGVRWTSYDALFTHVMNKYSFLASHMQENGESSRSDGRGQPLRHSDAKRGMVNFEDMSNQYDHGYDDVWYDSYEYKEPEEMQGFSEEIEDEYEYDGYEDDEYVEDEGLADEHEGDYLGENEEILEDNSNVFMLMHDDEVVDNGEDMDALEDDYQEDNDQEEYDDEGVDIENEEVANNEEYEEDFQEEFVEDEVEDEVEEVVPEDAPYNVHANVMCYMCYERGHIARNCPTYDYDW